jgi:hypothetical protein
MHPSSPSPVAAVLGVLVLVAALASEYPPFRIDAGEDDLAAAIAMPSREDATETQGTR